MYKANPFINGEDRKGRKFTASFSGGKDSMLAIYRCINAGMTPISMMTTCPDDANASWFHKIPEAVLFELSRSVSIPLTLIKTSGEDYNKNFEAALLQALSDGAEFAVFGDIDIDEHLTWCCDRCKAVGIMPYFPLWQEDRKKIVHEFVDCGFKAKILQARHEKLKDGFIGEILTDELLEKIAASGADICGENGEYHTLVIDGPIFSFPLSNLDTKEKSYD